MCRSNSLLNEPPRFKWYLSKKIVILICIGNWSTLVHADQFDRVSKYPLVVSVDDCGCNGVWSWSMAAVGKLATAAYVHAPSECVSSCCSSVWTYSCKWGIQMMVICRIPIAYGNVSYCCANTMIHIRNDNVSPIPSFSPIPWDTTNLKWNRMKK